jgi:3-phenylpropionate/trans-cinnamate dioxygenase ferredoxin subunit
MLQENQNFNLDDYQFYQVGEADELSPGGRIYIEAGNLAVIIFNIEGGYFAIQDTCTHDNGPLGDGEVEDHCVVCPRHGARFDIRTGKALSLPAIRNIATFPVRIVDGIIEIGLPSD